jgi:hypothetical protein
MTAKNIAESITLDRDKGDIWIDGFQLPWFVRDNVRFTAGGSDDIPSVEVSILCDNVHVIESLDDDLRWIQTLGARQMHEALGDFLAAEIERRWWGGFFHFMDHTTLPNVRERMTAPASKATS